MRFDVLQSLLVLFAAYVLGFAFPGKGFGHEAFRAAFTVANLVIAAIGSLSIFWFSSTPPTEVNTQRWLGLCVSLASAFIALCRSLTLALALYSGSQFVLWAILVRYTRKRLEPQPSEGQGASHA